MIYLCVLIHWANCSWSKCAIRSRSILRNLFRFIILMVRKFLPVFKNQTGRNFSWSSSHDINVELDLITFNNITLCSIDLFIRLLKIIVTRRVTSKLLCCRLLWKKQTNNSLVTLRNASRLEMILVNNSIVNIDLTIAKVTISALLKCASWLVY